MPTYPWTHSSFLGNNRFELKGLPELKLTPYKDIGAFEPIHGEAAFFASVKHFLSKKSNRTLFLYILSYILTGPAVRLAIRTSVHQTLFG